MAKRQPVVFTAKDRIPQVLCEPGKEREALEMMDKMGLILLLRPDEGRRPEGTLKPFAEKIDCGFCGKGVKAGRKCRCGATTLPGLAKKDGVA